MSPFASRPLSDCTDVALVDALRHQGADQILMRRRDQAPQALVFGHEPGQDAALEPG
jgi:hypothetical protein